MQDALYTEIRQLVKRTRIVFSKDVCFLYIQKRTHTQTQRSHLLSELNSLAEHTCDCARNKWMHPILGGYIGSVAIARDECLYSRLTVIIRIA